MAQAGHTMKLLYLLPEYSDTASGGIGTFYRHLLPMLARMGHEVRVVVGSGVFAEEVSTSTCHNGVRVDTLGRDRLFKYHAKFAKYAAMPGLRRHLAAAWAMWELAGKGEGVDVVEATDWGMLFLPCVIDGGPPNVVQLHGSMGQIDAHDPVSGEEAQGQLIRLLERAALAQASTVQAYSTSNSKFWTEQTGRAVSKVLPAWSPPAPLDKPDARSRRGLVLGRVQRWKGPHVLCEALDLMKDRAPCIDWIGRDMPFNRTSMSIHLQARWPEVWGRKVTVHPPVPPVQAAQAQTEAAFAVVPSLWDTFNFTCVETMGVGTPVICSTGAGASELISDGVNGFTFENGNASSLADALRRLSLLDDRSRRDVGLAGRETVVRSLEPEIIANQRIAEYRNISRQPAAAVGDWLRNASCPDTEARPSLDFLEQYSLKSLIRHTTSRVLRKMR